MNGVLFSECSGAVVLVQDLFVCGGAPWAPGPSHRHEARFCLNRRSLSNTEELQDMFEVVDE